MLFAFNYADQPQELPLSAQTELILGTAVVEPHGVTVWRS
ncbi:MAG: Beta-galactosidase C-terminal domain [Porticoccaceae bacterium]